MLGFLLTLLILASVAYSVYTGDAQGISAAVNDGAASAVTLCVSLAGAMALWGGIMNVAEKCGVTRAVTRLIKRPLKRLFGGLKSGAAYEYIAMNVTANLLGLGNAATPLGIKAMKELSADSGCTDRHTAFFILLNTASIQLLPVTVSAMRQARGAADPWDCTLPTIAVSACALTFGLITAALVYPKRRR